MPDTNALEQEWEEHRRAEAVADEQKWAGVPYSRKTILEQARGRRTVYIIQTCHWIYNDAFNEASASAGKSIAAFTSAKKALDELRRLEQETGQTLGIVEVYLEDQGSAERLPPNPEGT